MRILDELERASQDWYTGAYGSRRRTLVTARGTFDLRVWKHSGRTWCWSVTKPLAHVRKDVGRGMASSRTRACFIAAGLVRLTLRSTP